MINLNAANELINARQVLHGGGVGAPVKLADGSREGAALNGACVVLLSATLQAFVSDVFLSCSEKAFNRSLSGRELENYQATWKNWGNPSPKSIVDLFRRLGVDDVLSELSWQGQSNKVLRKNLDNLNQMRNRIAHGLEVLVGGKFFSLTLYQV